jgi:hypothetical protein
VFEKKVPIFDLKGKKKGEAGESFIKSIFIICMVLFRMRSEQVGHERDYTTCTCIQSFCR